jgi:hypothetical protein
MAYNLNEIDLEAEFLQENKKETKTFLFVPAHGQDMKTEYPELSAVEEFALLSNEELVFSWLIGNKTSPLSEKFFADRKLANQKALKWSKLETRLDSQSIVNFCDGRYSQKVDTAIRKMASFNPSIRMKAKMITEKAFNNLSLMIDIPIEEIEKMEVSDKKAYADLAKTITNTLDDLIVANEEAYGIKEKKKRKQAQKGSEATLMDLIMSE